MLHQEKMMIRLHLITSVLIIQFQLSVVTDIYSQWQGSSAQKLVKEHIKDGTLELYTKAKYEYPKMAYWLSRQEFYDEFPLYAFRDKIKQEIRTSKYHHTMKVKGKKETYKYN